VYHNRRVSGAHPNAYDAFAVAYSRDNENNAWNALYERPASLALVGEVAGKRVLDAGCGAGAHAAALVGRGAVVTGMDSSAGLLTIAAGRLGAAVDLHLADLAEPLPFGDNTFDVVLAALVMHYLPDWTPVLREFHRVLIPGGRLVVSTHHPFMDHVLAGGVDYFATYAFTDQWDKEGQTARMRFWHRPLSAMTRDLRTAGFTLDVIDEPQPDPAVRERDPVAWRSLTTTPRFLFIAATADTS